MSRLGVRHIALVLSIAAVAAAGCGSSSKSKTTAAPATPSTPATSSTATTSAHLTASTPITDPAVKAKIVTSARATAPAHVTTAQLKEVVDCVIKKYEAEGVKTAGELAQHASQAKTFGKECSQQLGIK